MPEQKKDERPSYEIAVEEALAAADPKEATLKLAGMYLRDISLGVKNEITGTPNSEASQDFNRRRNVEALSACAVATILASPVLLAKLVAGMRDLATKPVK